MRGGGKGTTAAGENLQQAPHLVAAGMPLLLGLVNWCSASENF